MKGDAGESGEMVLLLHSGVNLLMWLGQICLLQLG